MSGLIQQLVTISMMSFICLMAIPVLAASTSTPWKEDARQDKKEHTDTFTVDNNELQTTNDDPIKHPLDLLSIGDNAIQLGDGSANEMLFERDLSTWPYYLLSYDSGTDPQADFLISVAKVCGIIFIVGLIALAIRFFRLRRLRSELSH